MTVSTPISFSSHFVIVTKSWALIEWYDFLIHFAVVLGTRAGFQLQNIHFISFPNRISTFKNKHSVRTWLSYWFGHVSSKGVLCIWTNKHIMVSPWCIWIGLLQYPQRWLLNMLIVELEETKCSSLGLIFRGLRHRRTWFSPVFLFTAKLWWNSQAN